MKKRIAVLTFALLAVCCVAKAQEKASSIILGYGPVGYIHENIKLGDEKYKYDYKSFWNASFGYEKQFKGACSLTEVSYGQGKFDKYDLTGTSKWFNPAQAEDIYSVSVTQYVGTTINPNMRVQFPIYIGVGADYINGGPFHNLLIDGALKARMKFYITNNFGIYAGATGRLGWGSKKASEKKSSSDSSKGYNITNSSWSVDCGIVFGI